MFDFSGSFTLSQFSQQLKKIHSDCKSTKLSIYPYIDDKNIVKSYVDLTNLDNKNPENYNQTTYNNSNFTTNDICNTFTEENEIILDKFIPKFQNIKSNGDPEPKHQNGYSDVRRTNSLDNELGISLKKIEEKKYDSVKKYEKINNNIRISPLKYYDRNNKIKYYCLLCDNHSGIIEKGWNRHIKLYHSNKLYKDKNEMNYKHSKAGRVDMKLNDRLINDKNNDNMEIILVKTLRKLTVIELIELTRRYFPYIKIKTFDKYRLMECLIINCIKKNIENTTHKPRWLCYTYTR